MKRTVFFASILTMALAACSDKPSQDSSADVQPTKPTISADDRALLEKAQDIFKPLPTDNERKALLLLDEAHIALGHQLYFDERLSKNGNQSCNSCHDLAKGGVDNLPTSPGSVAGKFGNRNSPTVLNAGLQSSQFWDGRAADLAEQAKGPLINPVEMALKDHGEVERIVQSVPEYRQAFERAFADKKVSIDNIATAIAAFEEMLLTPSPWDSYLQGDVNALNAQQKAGLKKFIDHGCVACHTGVNLGGDTFQKFGLLKGPYWEFTGSTLKDTGRFEVTGAENDKYLFRVSGLRNIADTAPYFHDGSVATLDDAVDIMAKTQLGIELTPTDIKDIVAFLGSTSGKLPDIYQKAPQR
ncbi:MAG: cytochrome-c peroxidase [Moraxella sp.]|nr:cytochrome-c peroxidase [Moraxella sp.]